MKLCTSCCNKKDRAAFAKRTASPDGLQAHCKECVSANNREWYKRNKSHQAARARKTRYGITPAQYNARLIDQDGKCASCRDALVPGHTCVDHDHATDVVRGILCRCCNLALGYVKDDPTRLQGLITYLDSQ